MKRNALRDGRKERAAPQQEGIWGTYFRISRYGHGYSLYSKQHNALVADRSSVTWRNCNAHLQYEEAMGTQNTTPSNQLDGSRCTSGVSPLQRVDKLPRRFQSGIVCRRMLFVPWEKAEASTGQRHEMLEETGPRRGSLPLLVATKSAMRGASLLLLAVAAKPLETHPAG